MAEWATGDSEDEDLPSAVEEAIDELLTQQHNERRPSMPESKPQSGPGPRGNGEQRDTISRRHALKAGSASLASTMMSTRALPASTDAAPASRSKKRVLIAGGGISGLCCGYELMKRGHDVTVLEASGRTGGHVFTVRDPLAGGLYGDGGAEHFTKPGYEVYRQYVEEFNLPALKYPRRKNLIRFMKGKMYTEEMLADRAILKRFGFNRKEVDFLVQNPWAELRALYYGPYLDAFEDEYQPFGVGFDDLDRTSVQELLERDGASGTARSLIGGGSSSALYALWHAAILKIRGVAFYPTDLYRIEGGNQRLPDTFAAKLGNRVRLGCPITQIEHGESGVAVTYKEFGQTKTMSAEYLVNCIPLPTFSRIPVKPDWPRSKQFVIDNVTYGSYCRVLLQSRTKFWEADGISINMQLEEPELHGTSQMAREVAGGRGLLLGAAVAGTVGRRSVASFRKQYPHQTDTIEQAYVLDWSRDRWAAACERLPFPRSELAKFWPHVMSPVGRVHFAGSYADNLNWGQEAATRSANRVAIEIDQA